MDLVPSVSSVCAALSESVVLTCIVASADRRPVDPPPVVELRIFEGHTWQEAESKDITFLYNANFFLYATLEHARVMAHGRVQTPAANQPPVLTGMPVSGMAYLDRPQEAGYFLFPDLSVRHEGRYKLTFNLYEETKEDKDKDPDTPDPKMIAPGFSQATGGSFDFRMEVKSLDFLVFSAKKFPGLTESTQLSRVVAEQGCRVRIRRDVRMRRRDGKATGDYDNNNHGEDEYSRRRRTETPEVKYNRPRSMSGSLERHSFSSEAQRRPSGADYPPPPFVAHQPHSAGGHLQFLGNAAHAQYPHQSQGSSRPPSMPPSPSAYQTSHAPQYPPHPAGHQIHQGVHPQHAHPSTHAHQITQQQGRRPSYVPPPPQHQTYHQPERSQSQAQFCAPIPPAQREPAPGEFREPHPSQYRRSPAPPQLSRAPSKEFILPPYPAPTARSMAPDSALTLPPIKDLANLAPRPLPSLSSPTGRVPPLQPMPTTSSLPPPPPSVAGSKRTRDDLSRYDIDTPRYHNGAREDPQLLDEQGEPMLIYRRANGAEIEVPKNSIYS